MFSGYSFFDYKYCIDGYTGQDFDGWGRYIYLITSILLIVLLSLLFRKTNKEKIDTYLRILGPFMIAFYVIKTVWESFFDIKLGFGFNIEILPFDTCSIVMISAILAGYGKGKIKLLGTSWLVTGGVVGGVSNLLFLQALRFYPFFTFGALYSMIWHFLMVFTGVLLIITNYVELNFKTVIYAFILHMAISVIVIILDYALNLDFMLYLKAAGVPFFESVGLKLYEKGLSPITTIIVIILYFATFNLIVYFSLGIKLLVRRISMISKRKEKIQS